MTIYYHIVVKFQCAIYICNSYNKADIYIKMISNGIMKVGSDGILKFGHFVHRIYIYISSSTHNSIMLCHTEQIAQNWMKHVFKLVQMQLKGQ